MGGAPFRAFLCLLLFLGLVVPSFVRGDVEEDELLEKLGMGHQGMDRLAVMIEKGMEGSPAALEGVSVRRVWTALEGPTTEENFAARRRFFLKLMTRTRVLQLLSVDKKDFAESWGKHARLEAGDEAFRWIDSWLDRMVFRPRASAKGDPARGVVARPKRSKGLLLALGLGIVLLLAVLLIRAVPPRQVVDEELLRAAEMEKQREGAFLPPPSPEGVAAPPSQARRPAAARSSGRRTARPPEDAPTELSSEARNCIIQAKLHLRNGEGVEAIKLLQAVEKSSGSDVLDVRVLLVQAFARAGHGEIARKRFQNLELKRVDKAGRYDLACAFDDGGDGETAMKLLRSICSEDIAYKDAHARLERNLRGGGPADTTRPSEQGDGDGATVPLAPFEGENAVAYALRLAKSLVPDRYEVQTLIGRGGMGFVFLAEDRDLGRRVAIKMLSPLVAENERVVKRFYNETRAIANLDHPNVISVFDVVRARLPFYVMEYLEGQSLAALLLDRGAFAPRRGLGIARQVASALAHAHARRIIHRDVKPANILLLAGDELRLVDFGVAQLQDGGRMTQSGEYLGSPMYMAPEQLLGRRVDGRIDVYGLGLVLFEVFSGAFPFEAKNFFERTIREAPSLREYCEGIPVGIEELVGDCLAMDPDLRVPSAEAVLARVEELAGEEASGTQV